MPCGQKTTGVGLFQSGVNPMDVIIVVNLIQEILDILALRSIKFDVFLGPVHQLGL